MTGNCLHRSCDAKRTKTPLTLPKAARGQRCIVPLSKGGLTSRRQLRLKRHEDQSSDHVVGVTPAWVRHTARGKNSVIRRGPLWLTRLGANKRVGDGERDQEFRDHVAVRRASAGGDQVCTDHVQRLTRRGTSN